jgi:hypothetical protein
MRTKNHLKKLSKLSGSKFWKYIIENKHDLKLILDNDDTIVVLNNSNEDDENHISAPNYLGNSQGILELLKSIGICHEVC